MMQQTQTHTQHQQMDSAGIPLQQQIIPTNGAGGAQQQQQQQQQSQTQRQLSQQQTGPALNLNLVNKSMIVNQNIEKFKSIFMNEALYGEMAYKERLSYYCLTHDELREHGIPEFVDCFHTIYPIDLLNTKTHTNSITSG